MCTPTPHKHKSPQTPEQNVQSSRGRGSPGGAPGAFGPSKHDAVVSSAAISTSGELQTLHPPLSTLLYSMRARAIRLEACYT